MWAKVAEEMAVPWRAAEAMHWQLDSNNSHRSSPSRSHVHSHSQGSMPRDLGAPSPRAMYSRAPPMPVASSRTIVRRESIPPPPPPPMAMGPDHPKEVHYVSGPGLAPIQNQPPPRSAGMLPGVAELTTGVSPYSTPAGAPNVGSIAAASQGPLFSSLASYSMESAGSKRRASSPDRLQHEANHRRRMA